MAGKEGKCTCWKGYERVPGTKPCGKGSCRRKGELAEAADSLAKASTHKKGLESKGGDRDNWIERSGPGGKGGQLPAYIQHVALAIMKKGRPKGQAIAFAIGTIKRWARGGGNVDANTRAAAQKALGEWEAMKAKNKARKVTEAELDSIFTLASADLKALRSGRLLEGDEEDPLLEEDVIAILDSVRGPLRELSEAARQPRYPTGKYTEKTRGGKKKSRTHEMLLAEIKAAGHAGAGE